MMALLLSLRYGLSRGNRWGTRWSGPCIYDPGFGAIGYGAVVVLRRFVPELLRVLGTTAAATEDGIDAVVAAPEERADEGQRREPEDRGE